MQNSLSSNWLVFTNVFLQCILKKNSIKSMKIFKKSRLIIAYIGSPKRSVMTEFLAFFLGFLLLIKNGILGSQVTLNLGYRE